MILPKSALCLQRHRLSSTTKTKIKTVSLCRIVSIARNNLSNLVSVLQAFEVIDLVSQAEGSEDSSSTSKSNVSAESPVTATHPKTTGSDPVLKSKCAVCLHELGGRLGATTCGHVFCEDCIQTAVRAQHRCPICRTKLTLRQIHPLYL